MIFSFFIYFYYKEKMANMAKKGELFIYLECRANKGERKTFCFSISITKMK